MQIPQPTKVDIDSPLASTPKHKAPEIISQFNCALNPNAAEPQMQNINNSPIIPLPPKILSEEHAKPNRFKEFLNKQERFLANKQREIQNNTKSNEIDEMQELKSIPTIDSNSRILAEKGSTQTIFERLNGCTKNKFDNSVKELLPNRKKATGAPKCYHATKKQLNKTCPYQSIHPLEESNSVLVKKFRKEYDEAIKQAHIIDTEISKLNFDQILDGLKVTSSSEQEKATNNELWSTITEQKNTIDSEYLFIILSAIIFQVPVEGNDNLDHLKVNTLHRKYSYFQINRMNCIKASYNSNETKAIPSKNASNGHSLEMFLQRQKDLLNSITERQYKTNEKELIDCTFVPKITSAKNKSNIADRYTHLYELSKNVKHMTKSKDEVEYERQITELTFAPKLIKMQMPNCCKNVQIKGSESNIERMRVSYSRKLQNQKALALREYCPKNSRYKEPWIYIDVNMGNKDERISIYEGDNPDTVALKFAKANSNTLIRFGPGNYQ